MDNNIIPYRLKYNSLRKAINYLQSSAKMDAVFIWIPKTAGQSIYSYLHKNGCKKFKNIRSIEKLFPQRGFATFGHIYYFELVEKGLIDKKYDEKAFKFCFVRNPYDRAISLYHYFKRRNRIPEHVTFDSFCDVLRDRISDPIGLYHWKGFSQCNPQTYWIKDSNGKINLDFIGKFENLEEDFHKLCGNLNISKRTTLPKLNRSDRKHFSEYYNKKTINLINDIYKDDFEHFNYQLLS